MSGPDRLEPRLIGGQIMLAHDPDGAYVAWDDYAQLEAERDALRAIIQSDSPREELLWARAHVAELESALRTTEARADAAEAKLREAVEALRRLLPLARNDRYITQEPEVEDAEAFVARLTGEAQR